MRKRTKTRKEKVKIHYFYFFLFFLFSISFKFLIFFTFPVSVLQKVKSLVGKSERIPSEILDITRVKDANIQAPCDVYFLSFFLFLFSLFSFFSKMIHILFFKRLLYKLFNSTHLEEF